MPHKLLLADDSTTIQRVIELTFSGEDIEVLAVNDGEQAIARIPTERPDIILADIGMPKRTGYDVAEFVKRDPALKHIPVLLMAGAFEPVDDARAAETGCDGVLVKPFEPQHVIARVKELLDGAKGAPTRANAPVARPVERLALRSEERPASPRAEQVVPAAPSAEEETVGPFELIPASPSPDALKAPTVRSDESLDEYFDRLDAAFATLSSVTAGPSDSGSSGSSFDDGLDVPTLDQLLGDRGRMPSAPIDVPLGGGTAGRWPSNPFVAPPTIEPADATPTRAPAAAEPAHASPAPLHSIVADAFSALLAVEQGDPAATPVRLTGGAAEPAITDEFLDKVVQRVIERLSPDIVRKVVADVVSDVAERLVREEIERIRKPR